MIKNNFKVIIYEKYHFKMLSTCKPLLDLQVPDPMVHIKLLILGGSASWMETPETPFVSGRVAKLLAFQKKMSIISEFEGSDHIEDTGEIMV